MTCTHMHFLLYEQEPRGVQITGGIVHYKGESFTAKGEGGHDHILSGG